MSHPHLQLVGHLADYQPLLVQLLQTMNIEVKLPITYHVDNIGAIWLSNNRTTSDRTKHIDIRTSFVKEYQEDGKIIIKFV